MDDLNSTVSVNTEKIAKIAEAFKQLSITFKQEIDKNEVNTQRNFERSRTSTSETIEVIKLAIEKADQTNQEAMSIVLSKLNAIDIVLNGDGKIAKGLRVEVNEASLKERDRAARSKLLASISTIILTLASGIGFSTLSSGQRDNAELIKSIVSKNNEQDIKLAEDKEKNTSELDGLRRDINRLLDRK